MEKNVIKKIINIWDPLGVYGLAPEDEYDDIVAKVAVFFETKTDRETIKNYLLAQYYNERVKSEARVNELIDILLSLKP
ncbi:MAG: hypothetical protein LBK69_02545 [Syntrophomonadaceae bacterium]|jgi:hypothetical protein|nr:hypothetical protein [Syntrophomonadaceae bacterium]